MPLITVVSVSFKGITERMRDAERVGGGASPVHSSHVVTEDEFGSGDLRDPDATLGVHRRSYPFEDDDAHSSRVTFSDYCKAL